MYYLSFLLCSLVVAVPLEKRQVASDVSSLENKLEETLNNISHGVQTSDLSKAINELIALADVIISSPEVMADKGQVDEVISDTTETIKNHAETGKISGKLWKLSRAIIFLSDLANDFTLLKGENEKLYKAAAAIKATGQVILDSLQFVGEDLIRFNFRHEDQFVRSARLAKRDCWGLSLGRVCVGIGYR